MSAFPERVDIFCRVIDNYGDAGVCGRLARQLACEHHKKVRLFIDDPHVLEVILPDLCDHVQIHRWEESFIYEQAADLIIEAFACDIPDQVLGAMKQRQKSSVWVDLEYLTAEDWAGSCHAIPSIHPSTGLTKTLFFPGFSEKTGGLIRETFLPAECAAFQSDRAAQNTWRQKHHLPPVEEGILDVSMFCYPSAPKEALYGFLSQSGHAVRVFEPARENFGQEVRGDLTVIHIPFFCQADYDRLLWGCDLNFVRGEDSFVRAQYAGRPMIWNIYVQEELAHLAKLEAFLEIYAQSFPDHMRKTLAKTFHLWNEEGQIEKTWDWFFDHLPQLTKGAENWRLRLYEQSSLSQRLLQFCTTVTRLNKDQE